MYNSDNLLAVNYCKLSIVNFDWFIIQPYVTHRQFSIAIGFDILTEAKKMTSYLLNSRNKFLENYIQPLEHWVCNKQVMGSKIVKVGGGKIIRR